MKKKIQNFIRNILFLNLIIIILSFLIFKFTKIGDFYFSIFPILLFFFNIITIIFHYFQITGKEKKFFQKFMLTSTIKLFIFLIFLIVYVFLNKENAIPFIVFYLILYFIFQIFEIISLLKAFKK